MTRTAVACVLIGLTGCTVRVLPYGQGQGLMTFGSPPAETTPTPDKPEPVAAAPSRSATPAETTPPAAAVMRTYRYYPAAFAYVDPDRGLYFY